MKKVLNFGSLLLILNLLIASCGKDPKIEQQIGNLDVLLYIWVQWEVLK